MPSFPFTGGAYESRTLSANAQSCINLYPELDESGKNGSGKSVLYSTPGCKLIADVGTNLPIRGMHSWDGSLYVVSGLKLYEISPAGVATLRGTMDAGASTSPRVSMAHNNTQMILVDGSTIGHIYTKSTTTLAKITDADYPGGPVVVYSDGYFLLTKTGTQEMHISAIQDGTSWNPLEFISSEGSPDKLISIIPNHREIWTFGEATTEVYYNSGSPDFPFERIQGAFIELGCTSPYSVAQMDNNLMWVSRDIRGNGLVVRTEGYTPQVVSTRAMEAELATYPTLEDAFAFSYQQAGHQFYVVTFPSGNATWAYDVTTRMWHERSFFDPISGPMRHLANCYSFCWGRHFVGDYRTGKVYELDLETYTDDSQPIRRERTSPYVHEDRARISFFRFELDMEFGRTMGDEDPKIMLQFSDDGARTWSNELQASIGKQGEYLTRAVWRRLGCARQRLFRVSVTDSVNVVIISGHLDIIKAAF